MADNAKTTTTTVIPTMRYNDAAAAIDWLCEAFGFEKHMLVPGEDGTIDKAATDRCSEYCGWTGGVIGFVVGAIGGAVAGYAWLGHEKWSDVPVEDLRVSVGPGYLELRIAI